MTPETPQDARKAQELREAYEAGWHDSHDHFEPFERSWFPPASVDDGFTKFLRRIHSKEAR